MNKFKDYSITQNPYACGDCKNRCVGCHATCEKYKKFKAWNEETKAKMKKEQEQYNYMMTSILEAKKRARR